MRLEQYLMAFAIVVLVTSIIALAITSEKKDTIINKNQEEIFELQNRIDSLKLLQYHGISINDSTVSVITNLVIQNKPHKAVNTEALKLGKNEFYFVLNENTAIKMAIMKYK